MKSLKGLIAVALMIGATSAANATSQTLVGYFTVSNLTGPISSFTGHYAYRIDTDFDFNRRMRPYRASRWRWTILRKTASPPRTPAFLNILTASHPTFSARYLATPAIPLTR